MEYYILSILIDKHNDHSHLTLHNSLLSAPSSILKMEFLILLLIVNRSGS